MENTSQLGPSEGVDITGFVRRDEFREGMNALHALIQTIIQRLEPETRRGVPLQQPARIHRLDSREETVFGEVLRPPEPMSSFAGILDEPRTSKHLSRVSSMVPPGGRIWAGLSDRRSAKRFLIDVGSLVLENGLDAEGLIHFLLNKCVTPDLSRELSIECADLYRERPLSHERIAEKLGEVFNRKYRFTNSSDRMMDYLDGGLWSKEAKDLDHYLSILRGIFRDCELVDIRLDERMKRRHLLRWLPKELRDYAEERLDENSTVDSLSNLLLDWTTRKNHNYFKGGSKGISVKAAVVESSGDAPQEDVDPLIAAAARNRGDCLLCGNQEHYVRDCPSLNLARESLKRKDDRKDDKPSNPSKVSPGKLNWANTFRLIGASGVNLPSTSPTLQVTIRGSACSETRNVMGLVDTGAACTLFSKGLAERLFDQGVIGHEDVRGVRELTFTFADGSSRGEIGHCLVNLNGKPRKVYVLPDSSPDLILGVDFIEDHPEALLCLLNKFGASDSIAVKNVCVSSVDGEASDKCLLLPLDDVKGQNENVAEWPLIKLPWKSNDRPSRVFAQVQPDALNLERRLRRNGLADMYSQVIDTWVGNGWLVEARPESVKNFLTHFEVVKKSPGPNATLMQKCRVVVNGSKLKVFLHAGVCSASHDLMANLLLWRMAERYVVVDISNAYLRLGVHPEDGIYLGICWKNKAYVFSSLPMGIQPSASFLQTCVDSFLSEWVEQQPSRDGEVMTPAPYMDDLMNLLFASVPGSIPVAREEEVKSSLLSFLEEKRLPASREKTAQTGQPTKYLGVKVEDDHIVLRPKIEKPAFETMTRRKAASVLASCVDPLGLLVEHNMRGRLLLSELGGGPWKQVVPRAVAAKVNAWVDNVNISSVKVPRQLICDQQLFVFCDASQTGWGVVVIAQDVNGIWRRLYGKANTLKANTLKAHQRPWGNTSAKIELLALLSAVQIIQLLTKLLARAGKSPYIFLGTDSEVNVNRLYDPDTAVLINDIWQRKTAALVSSALNNLGVNLFFIPGHLNPADAPSRGIVNTIEETEGLYRRAVEFFESQPDRCFVPVKIPMSCCNVEKVKPVMQVRAISVARPEHGESLNDRYLRERTSSLQSKEEWFHTYQKADPLLLKNSPKYHLVNDVWVRKGRQKLDGTPLFQILVPAVLVFNILFSFHDCDGHLGPNKTLAKVLDHFTWSGVTKDVKRYAAACPTCQLIKGNRHWLTPPSSIISDGRCWSVISCDFVKGFTDGVLMVITDMYTRFVFSYAVANETAKTIVNVLTRLFWSEGPCLTLVTDNAQCFLSDELAAFLARMGVHHKKIPRYSGFYAGWYERGHATLIKCLSTLLIDSRSWRKLLDKATFYMNNRPYEFSESGNILTPFMVFKGRSVFRTNAIARHLDVDDPRPSEQQLFDNLSALQDESEDIRSRFEEVWKRLRQDSYLNIEKRTDQTDVFEVGDRVYVWIPKLRREGKCGPSWEGPYTIAKQLTQSGTLFEVNGRNEHAYNMKRAITLQDNSGNSAVPPIPQPNLNPTGSDELIAAPGDLQDVPTEPRRSERIRLRDEQDGERGVAKRLRVAVVQHLVDWDSPGGELLLV